MLSPAPFSKPMALVALAWGSRSMSNTRLPFSARQAERFTAVVVLPTPPFCLAIANSFIRTTSLVPLGQHAKDQLYHQRFTLFETVPPQSYELHTLLPPAPTS